MFKAEHCPACGRMVRVHETTRVDVGAAGDVFRGVDIDSMRTQKRRCTACGLESVQTHFSGRLLWTDTLTGEKIQA